MKKKILGTVLMALSALLLIYDVAIFNHMRSGEDIDYSWILPQVPPVVFLLLSLAMFIYGLWVLLPWPNREDSTEKPEEIPAPPKKRAPKREGK